MDHAHEMPKKQKPRFEIQKLEERLAPAHLGNVVDLPKAALNGQNGLETVADVPANHKRASIIAILIG